MMLPNLRFPLLKSEIGQTLKLKKRSRGRARHAEVAVLGNVKPTAGASAHQALSTGTGGLEASRKASYSFWYFWSLPSHEHLRVTFIKFQTAWTLFFLQHTTWQLLHCPVLATSSRC